MFAVKVYKRLLNQSKLHFLIRNNYGSTSFFNEKRTDQNQHVKTVYHNAPKYQNKVAVYDRTGSYTFSNIYVEAKELSMKISRQLNGKTGERVMFLCPNDTSYIITIWAIWMSGQIAVPLSPLHPESLLQYYMNDTNSNLIVSSPEFEQRMGELANKANVKLYLLDQNLLEISKTRNVIDESTLDNTLPLDFYQNNNAMILYTSGTTGNPKGVVLSHKNISVHVNILTTAWKWSQKDVILHTLPLHHVHGTVNALFCPLFMGATTIMVPKFDTQEVWSYLLNQNKNVNERVSVFMAVPTIYAKLIEDYENRLQDNALKIKNFLTDTIRLMTSGSAPLPNPLYEKWLEISGQRLLERYGMTEIGMCLSNLYDSDRAPGYVGLPLPSVSIELASQENGDILLECVNNDGDISINYKNIVDGDVSGELLVKGDSVFKEYYNKPKETAKEFTEDGWFKTGDITEYDKAVNKFRMLGRKSADIIKSGGYKISALQIETILLAHPGIKDCAVLGVHDDVYGEKVAAVVMVNKGFTITLEELKSWALEKMPKYWVPSVLKLVDEIPKNAMGKVNKKELNKALFKYWCSFFYKIKLLHLISAIIGIKFRFYIGCSVRIYEEV